MPKITLDRNMFKALASETRLNILKTLDGKKLGLNEISKTINLNKATLHEHLTKLNDAGLVKRTEREGHKWIYYKLTWKGESLLHPENTRIVVMFSLTFFSLFFGIINLINYIKTNINIQRGSDFLYYPNFYEMEDNIMLIGKSTSTLNDINIFSIISIICFIVFFLLMVISIWRYNVNKNIKI